MVKVLPFFRSLYHYVVEAFLFAYHVSKGGVLKKGVGVTRQAVFMATKHIRGN
jgi:hypothetical protein